MAQRGEFSDRTFATHDVLVPDGELGVLVCLMAVPVIWTVLITALVSSCAMITTTALLLAVATGCFAVMSRLVWLHRHADRVAGSVSNVSAVCGGATG
jgi:hypothetical protein